MCQTLKRPMLAENYFIRSRTSGEEPAVVLASSMIIMSWGLLGWLRSSQMPMPGLTSAQSVSIPHFYLPGSALSPMETAIPKPGIWTPSHMLNPKRRLPKLERKDHQGKETSVYRSTTGSRYNALVGRDVTTMTAQTK